LSANGELLRALQLIAHYLSSGTNDQLLLSIGGGAGTGKSHVIKSIELLFDLLGIGQTLLLSAPTGAAASVIGGYTIHALSLLPK
ncbi:hypothetical protein CALCODRAFT_410727, partial [Calocera cornea HHB12733]